MHFLPLPDWLHRAIRLCQLFAGQHLIALKIFFNGLVHNLLRECPVIARMSGQPIACKLLVEGRLGMSCLVALCRPETGAVRSQHLITKNDVAILIQTELKLGICDNDTFFQCVLRTFFVKCNRVFTQLICILLSLAREVFFQMIYALLIGDVFIMIANLCLSGRCVDRLRQLVRLF